MDSTDCDYLSPQQIAARYGFDPTAVYRWIYGITVNGHPVRLKAMKVGKSWRVRPGDWEEFLRLCNPDTWQAVAELQEKERREAEALAREEERGLEADLGGKGRRKAVPG